MDRDDGRLLGAVVAVDMASSDTSCRRTDSCSTLAPHVTVEARDSPAAPHLDGVAMVDDEDEEEGMYSTLHSPTTAGQPAAPLVPRQRTRRRHDGDASPSYLSRVTSYNTLGNLAEAAARLGRSESMVVIGDDEDEHRQREILEHNEDRQYAFAAAAARREADAERRRQREAAAVTPAATPVAMMAVPHVVPSPAHSPIHGGAPAAAPTPAMSPAVDALAPSSLMAMPAGMRPELFHDVPPDITPPQTALFIHRLNRHHQALAATMGSQPALNPMPPSPSRAHASAATPPPESGGATPASALPFGIGSARLAGPLPGFQLVPGDPAPPVFGSVTTIRTARHGGPLDMGQHMHPSMVNSFVSDDSDARHDRLSTGTPGFPVTASKLSHSRRTNAWEEPTKRCSTRLMDLPNDAIVWIITGFLNLPFQGGARLVCRRMNHIITSACVVWYRRVPHTIFIAHLTHRLKLESEAMRAAQQKVVEAQQLGFVDTERFRHLIPAAPLRSPRPVPTPRRAPANNGDGAAAVAVAPAPPPDLDPDRVLVIPTVHSSQSTLPASAAAGIQSWLRDEQLQGGFGDNGEEEMNGWAAEDTLARPVVAESAELLDCHTFTDMMGNQLQYLFNTAQLDSPDERDKWFTGTCLRGCCHRQWAHYLASCHERERHTTALNERARVGAAVFRAMAFPASKAPSVIVSLIVFTYLCLLFFAVTVWGGLATPAIQFGPLWAFFILLFPLLYIFFGSSTIEPMVLSFLGFVGFTFSTVLVYFYRVVSPYKAMSWISCSTPLLLCMSCCATYSFLMLHRLADEVTVIKHRLIALGTCSLPAWVLIFATLTALEMDETLVVTVFTQRSSASSSRTATGAPTDTPPPAPPSIGFSPSNTGLDGLMHCTNTLRFSALVACIALSLLAWISMASIQTFSFAVMRAHLAHTAMSQLCFVCAYVLGACAGFAGFVQDAVCFPTIITFVFAMLSIVMLCAAQCLSVMSSTVLRDGSALITLSDSEILSIRDEESKVVVSFTMGEAMLLLSPSHDESVGLDMISNPGNLGA